jgi:hypothetical protein
MLSNVLTVGVKTESSVSGIRAEPVTTHPTIGAFAVPSSILSEPI